MWAVNVQRAREGSPGDARVYRTPVGWSSEWHPGEEMPSAPGPGAEVLLQLIQAIHLQHMRSGEQATQLVHRGLHCPSQTADCELMPDATFRLNALWRMEWNNLSVFNRTTWISTSKHSQSKLQDPLRQWTNCKKAFVVMWALFPVVTVIYLFISAAEFQNFPGLTFIFLHAETENEARWHTPQRCDSSPAVSLVHCSVLW